MVETTAPAKAPIVMATGSPARRVNVGNTGNTAERGAGDQFPLHIMRYAISEDGGGAPEHTRRHRHSSASSGSITTPPSR
jgi:hypothetical protein